MILNFICKDVTFKDNAQIAIFEKSGKTSNDKPTEVIGKTEINSAGISITIKDPSKFNAYAIGESYNFELLSGKIAKPEGLGKVKTEKTQ